MMAAVVADLALVEGTGTEQRPAPPQVSHDPLA